MRAPADSTKPITGTRERSREREHRRRPSRRAPRRASRPRTRRPARSRRPARPSTRPWRRSTPSPGRAFSPIRREQHLACAADRSEPGSQSTSSRSSGVSRSSGRWNERKRHVASRHSTALWPPKPNEFEIASGRSPGRAPAARAAVARSRGRAPGRARSSPSVGGIMRARRARIVATASTAPAAPSRCPIADLVEEIGIARGVLAERGLQRDRLGAIVERRRGAVGVDVDEPVGCAPASVERARDRRAPRPRRRRRRGDVVGVRGRAVAAQDGRGCGRRVRAPPRRSRAPARRAPSPITKPSRRASNGREMPISESASSAPNAARESGVSAASAPPVTIAVGVAAPGSHASPTPIAWRPPRRPKRRRRPGPLQPWRMLTAPAAALPIISGTASGETRFGPCSISVASFDSIVPMPPMPVPMIEPIRASRRYGSPRVPAGVGERLDARRRARAA